MLFPDFDPRNFSMNFGQFMRARLIWDLGASTGQSTLYYANEQIIPFWDFGDWAHIVVQKVVDTVWAVNPLNPLKPALSRVVSNQYRLREVHVSMYDSVFDLITPTEASVSVNQTGLMVGAPEDVAHTLNAQFNLRPAAQLNLWAPKRSYVSLPPPPATHFTDQGELTHTFTQTARAELAALALSIDMDGTPFGISTYVPIRIKTGAVLVGGNPILAVGFGRVASVNPRPVIGFRRSRRE